MPDDMAYHGREFVVILDTAAAIIEDDTYAARHFKLTERRDSLPLSEGPVPMEYINLEGATPEWSGMAFHISTNLCDPALANAELRVDDKRAIATDYDKPATIAETVLAMIRQGPAKLKLTATIEMMP